MQLSDGLKERPLTTSKVKHFQYQVENAKEIILTYPQATEIRNCSGSLREVVIHAVRLMIVPQVDESRFNKDN